MPLPPSFSDGALSLSADTVRCHSSGGLPHFTYTDEQASWRLARCLAGTLVQLLLSSRTSGPRLTSQCLQGAEGLTLLQGKDLTSCALDPQSSQKAILGRMSGTMSVLDVQTGQIADTVSLLFTC